MGCQLHVQRGIVTEKSNLKRMGNKTDQYRKSGLSPSQCRQAVLSEGGSLRQERFVQQLNTKRGSAVDLPFAGIPTGTHKPHQCSRIERCHYVLTVQQSFGCDSR